MIIVIIAAQVSRLKQLGCDIRQEVNDQIHLITTMVRTTDLTIPIFIHRIHLYCFRCNMIQNAQSEGIVSMFKTTTNKLHVPTTYNHPWFHLSLSLSLFIVSVFIVIYFLC